MIEFIFISEIGERHMNICLIFIIACLSFQIKNCSSSLLKRLIADSTYLFPKWHSYGEELLK